MGSTLGNFDGWIVRTGGGSVGRTNALTGGAGGGGSTTGGGIGAIGTGFGMGFGFAIG